MDVLRMSHMRLQQRCHAAEAHVERLLTENKQLRGEVEHLRSLLAKRDAEDTE